MDLIKSGIAGLDELLKGGIKKNSSILLSGVPGSGKTIFAMQFIYQGARLNEPGLFITCEEREDLIIEYAKNLGFDFEKYKDKLFVVYHSTAGRVATFGDIIDIIKKNKIKRVVLDSLTFFSYIVQDSISFRKEVLEFLSNMRENNVTFLATSERSIGSIDKVRFKPEDFLFEGLLLLFKIRKGSDFERCISVQKMRRQEHMTGIYPFKIGKNGIEIYPKQIPFSLTERE